MQIGCDRSRAMIVRIAGAAWLQSGPAVYSHSPRLPGLIVPSSSGKRCNVPGRIHLASLTLPYSIFRKKDWERIIFHLIQTSGRETEKWKSTYFPWIYSLIWWVWCWASWGGALEGSCSCSFTIKRVWVTLYLLVVVLRILVYKSNQ